MGIFRRRKSRKYPVQYDDRGQSLRARRFELYDDGKRPVDVAKELGMKQSTAYRYFQQWKQLGPNSERKYTYVKGLLKQSASYRNHTLELFARACGIQQEDLETILAQPHGLRRLMTGKLYFPGHANADHKRLIALEAGVFISNYLIKDGGQFDDVRFALEHLMKQNRRYRKAEEAEIEEYNQMIAFTRKVIKADAQAKREGRIKPDRLSEKEIATILGYGDEFKARNLETLYWYRIAVSKSEGLTVEQAREKVYQDLLEKGDVKGAKAMRAYQDIIHPLKADDQSPQPS